MNDKNYVVFNPEKQTCKIVADSREKAAYFISEAMDILKTYGLLSVADLEEMVTGSLSSYKTCQYGWDKRDIDISGEDLYPISSKRGWIVLFPITHSIGELNAEVTTAELNDIPFKASKIAENDIINRPAHYQSETGLETIDVIEAFTLDLKGIEATDTGNIIKYACRWSKKNGIQDLEKLVWYAQHLIEHLKKKEQYENE